MLPSGDYEGEKTIQESIRSTGSNELIGDRLSRMSGGTQISRTDLSPMEKSGPRYVESEKKKFKQKLKYFDPKEGLGLTKQVSNIIKAVVLQDTASLREIDCSPQLMDCIWVNGMSILQFSQNEEINAILMAKGAKPKLQRIHTTSLDHLYFSCKINSQRYSVCCSNLFDNLYRLVKAIETHNASQIEGMDFPPEILSRVWFCSLGDLTFIHPKDPKLPGGFHLLYSIFCYSTEENKKKMVAVAKVLIEKYGEKEIQPLYQTKNSQDKMLTYGAFAIAIKLDSEKLFQLLLNNSRVVITESDIVFAEGHGKREWARRLRDRRDMPQCLPSASTALPMQVDTNLSPQELPSTSSASSMQVNTLKTNHSTKIFKVVAIPSRKKDSSREEYERNIEEKKKYIPEDVDAYLLNVGSVNDISSIVYRDGLSITGIIIHFQGRITLKAVCNMNFINLMDLMKGLTEINLLFQQTISQKLKEEIISQMKKKIQSRHRNMSINVIDQEQVDIRYDMGERKRRDGPYAQQRGATTALASSSGSVVAGESDQKDYMDEEDYEIMEVSPSASDLDSETDDDSSKKRRRDASHDGEDASHDSEDASHDGEDASHDGEDLPPALKRTKTSEAGDDSLGDRSCDGPWNGDDSSKKRRRDASHDGDDSAPGSSAGINTSADRPNSPNHLVSQIGIFSRVGAVAISGHDAAQIYPR